MYQWDVFALFGSLASGSLRQRWLGYVCAYTRLGAEAQLLDRGLHDRLQEGERLGLYLVGIYVERAGCLTLGR